MFVDGTAPAQVWMIASVVLMRPDAQTAAVTDGLRSQPDTGPIANAIAVMVIPTDKPIVSDGNSLSRFATFSRPQRADSNQT
jgi:hypothetical protein